MFADNFENKITLKLVDISRVDTNQICCFGSYHLCIT